MALEESSISIVCRSVAAFLRDAFHGAPSAVNVIVGPPAKAAESISEAHCLNLFFHRFEPAGLFTDGAPGDIAWIRIYCLITPFATNDDGISAGENDLRLLGAVMRLFHETPVLAPLTVANEQIRVQMVHQPLSLDDINRIWSTQKDVAFRPSVAYEIALAPIIPAHRTVRPLSTAGIDVTVCPSKSSLKPVADWAPKIAFIVDGEPRDVLFFEKGSAELANATPQVAIAGEVEAQVILRWETWNATSGWQPIGTATSATAHTASLDTLARDSSSTISLQLPFKDRAGQAVLFATRGVRRPGDDVAIEVRSNPLLVQLRSPAP